MSAIGTMVKLYRVDLVRCLDLARRIRTESVGWLWKRQVEVGAEAFHDAWNAAVKGRADFQYSGYVLGDYFLVQAELNGYGPDPFDSADGRLLARGFTAAFPMTSPVLFPALQSETLRAHCKAEYGDDAGTMHGALLAAHAFYLEGAKAVTSELAVAFVID